MRPEREVPLVGWQVLALLALLALLVPHTLVDVGGGLLGRKTLSHPNSIRPRTLIEFRV